MVVPRKIQARAALLLYLSLFFFSLVSACPECPPTPSPPRPPPITSSAASNTPQPSPSPTPPTPATPPAEPEPSPAPSEESCPEGKLKFGFCGDVLKHLIGFIIGDPPEASSCCPILPGLLDFEGAVCLCKVLKGSIYGIPISIPISFNLLFNFCGKSPPKGFECQ